MCVVCGVGMGVGVGMSEGVSVCGCGCGCVYLSEANTPSMPCHSCKCASTYSARNCTQGLTSNNLCTYIHTYVYTHNMY